MKRKLRAIGAGIATTSLSVLLAAIYAFAQRGGSGELGIFFLWSMPLGIGVAIFGLRPRFSNVRAAFRAPTTALIGLVLALIFTFVGGLLIGPWMLAWDFPVFYCWAIAGAAGTLFANGGSHLFTPFRALTSFLVSLASLGGLWMYQTRPEPAILIVYEAQSGFDAAQRILDSVLTEPHPSGQGRDIKWQNTFYARTRTSDGHVAALIGFRHSSARDSVRAALRNNPLVREMVDTSIAR